MLKDIHDEKLFLKMLRLRKWLQSIRKGEKKYSDSDPENRKLEGRNLQNIL